MPILLDTYAEVYWDRDQGGLQGKLNTLQDWFANSVCDSMAQARHDTYHLSTVGGPNE